MTTDELLGVELVVGGGRAELFIDGELDLCSAPLLEETVTRCADDDAIRSIVVDLRNVSFCDAAGYQAVARSRRSARARRTECRVRPSPALRRIAAIVGASGRDDPLT